VVAVPVDARRRHEGGELVEQLKGRETKLVATVHIGLGEPVDKASLRRRERPDTGGGVKPRPCLIKAHAGVARALPPFSLSETDS
jgi:hypothetical protein